MRAMVDSLESRMVAARSAGKAAAENGETRVNPWRPDAKTSVDRTLSIMWARGYSEGNPVTLDA